MNAPIHTSLRMALVLSVTALAGLMTGCPDPPPPPPAFEACGTVNIQITGRMGLGSLAPRDVNTTATLEEDSTSVNWTTAGSATGSVLDGASASGTTAHNPQNNERTFTAAGTSGSHTLEVTGTINADCTGSGSWTVKITDGGRVIGRGRWTIQ